MKLIETAPGYCTAADPIHGRAIRSAPRVGKGVPIEAHAMRAADATRLARDAAVPVDDRAENVEQERTRQSTDGGAALQKVNRICMTGAKVRRCAAHGPCVASAARCSGVE